MTSGLRPRCDLLLSILVPTYNRSAKLLRLLRNIEAELRSSAEGLQIDVLVSDNCSSDSTPQVLAEFTSKEFNLVAYRQPENLGFDRNAAFLYREARSQFVWFLSDDDILKSGSVAKVAHALAEHNPDVLLFEFEQPPGTQEKRLTKSSSPVCHTEPREIIDALTTYPKLSAYVLRHLPLTQVDLAELREIAPTGFWFVALSFSVVSKQRQAAVLILPEFLAGADEDFGILTFAPSVWGRYFQVYRHPYVERADPGRWRAEECRSYLGQIDILFAVEAGIMSTIDPAEYRQACKQLTWRGRILRSAISSLCKFILLKTRMVYPAYRLYGIGRGVARALRGFGRESLVER